MGTSLRCPVNKDLNRDKSIKSEATYKRGGGNALALSANSTAAACMSHFQFPARE